MASRIIQTFIETCNDCPNCHYYSGGMYECGITDERIRPEDRKQQVGSICPLPFAGRTDSHLTKERDLLRKAVARYCDRSRMGTVEPAELQRVIDDAFANFVGEITQS